MTVPLGSVVLALAPPAAPRLDSRSFVSQVTEIMHENRLPTHGKVSV